MRWHAFGQHGLSGTRRADHQKIVATGRRDRDGPLGHLLAADIGEVFFVVRKLLKQLIEPRGRGRNVKFAGQKGDRLREAIDGDHFEAFDDGRLARIRAGHDDAANTWPRLSETRIRVSERLAHVMSRVIARRSHRHRERALHRPRAAVERELARRSHTR